MEFNIRKGDNMIMYEVLFDDEHNNAKYAIVIGTDTDHADELIDSLGDSSKLILRMPNPHNAAPAGIYQL